MCVCVKCPISFMCLGFAEEVVYCANSHRLRALKGWAYPAGGGEAYDTIAPWHRPGGNTRSTAKYDGTLMPRIPRGCPRSHVCYGYIWHGNDKRCGNTRTCSPCTLGCANPRNVDVEERDD
jgi:hypothetical protein